MILPTKHLPHHNSLLAIGAEVLRHLDEPKTVSRLWSEVSDTRKAKQISPITYDWFVLALDLLFMLETVDFDRGRLFRVST